MQHLVASRTVVGFGETALVLEIKGRSVRIKRRGMPELLVPLEHAAELGRALMSASKA